jgi:hypothetical protein
VSPRQRQILDRLGHRRREEQCLALARQQADDAAQIVDEAEIEWRELEKIVRSVNGQMITIWHNIFLGSQKRFAGWGDRYVQWLKTLKP